MNGATTAGFFTGDLLVQTGCLKVGTTTISGTCLSDRRLKTRIKPYPQLLDKLAELQPVTFSWKRSNPKGYPSGGERANGLIAQQVEKIFPSLVTTDKRGYNKLNYTPLPFMMLEAVRELKARNDDLRAAMNNQQGQIATLREAEAQKDAQIRAMSREITQLKRQASEIAGLEARLARDEAQQTATREKLARVAHRQQKHAGDELARAEF